MIDPLQDNFLLHFNSGTEKKIKIINAKIKTIIYSNGKSKKLR